MVRRLSGEREGSASWLPRRFRAVRGVRILVGDVGQKRGHLVLVPLQPVRLLPKAGQELGELAVENGPGPLVIGIQVHAGLPVENPVQVLAQGLHGPVAPPGAAQKHQGKQGAKPQGQAPGLVGPGKAHTGSGHSQGQEQKELDVELPVPEKFHRQSSAL